MSSTTFVVDNWGTETAVAESGLNVSVVLPSQCRRLQHLCGHSVLYALTWFPCDALLLRPEYAWLSVNPERFIRLPVSLAELKRRIEEARQPGKPVPPELFIPMGQARWAIDQMQVCAASANWDEARARSEELRKFCATHWHGWFSDVLEKVDRALVVRDAPACADQLRRVGDALGPVAVFGAFSEFFHGAGRDIVNKGPGQVQAVLKYGKSTGDGERPRMVERLLDTLRGENWWVPLHDALLAVQEKLDQIAQCGFDPESLLQGRLSAAVDNLESCGTIADGLISDPDTWLQKLGDAETHISVVINAMLSIESAAGILKADLQGEDLNAQASADRRRV